MILVNGSNLEHIHIAKIMKLHNEVSSNMELFRGRPKNILHWELGADVKRMNWKG